MEPNEHMLLLRSYPDAQFDFEAFQNAQMSAYVANQNNQSKSSRSISWNIEGPGNIGGRFNCLAVHPTNSNIIYAGAATGGIFKTNDGGATWNPIFDSQPFIAIGCITIDNLNPNTIWVGTGDANISGLCYIGDGIYKSTDAGATWVNMGLNNQKVFSKICVDPTNSNVIYAASMGQPFVRDNNRGLYKSTDGGSSWNSILFVSNQAGIIDMVINPTNPQVLYVSSFTRIRNNLEAIAAGTDSKIWKTINGGANWNVLSNGLPTYSLSRIGLTIFSANPNILYTVITDSTQYLQGIYKTVDAGATWTSIDITNLSPSIYNGYGWYFGKIYVNPSNSNQIYVLGVDSYTTSDGGNSWNPATPPWWQYDVHGDHHYMHFINGNTILLCTDGGIYKTTDNCNTWTDIENIPVNQVYHSNENPTILEDYWCGVQDNGTTNGNSSNINSWPRVYGGDGFQSYVDPITNNVIYAETQWGGIVFSDDGGFNFYDCTNGINVSDQTNWDMPYIISSFDHTILYSGTNQVYKMLGAPYGTWSSISGDLTDGLDNNLNDLHTITTISESPLNPNIIYAGTADANVWNTLNGGNTWNNVTGSLPVRYVTCVCASPNLTNNIYVTHSGYRDGDNFSHIHKSINSGNSWIDISGDLPSFAINNVLVSNLNENIIFIASDAGVYYTTDGGVIWLRLGNNMPMMPVFEIEFNTAHTKIIASTFARSVQTIDITGITTGINEAGVDSEIFVFPNPASDYIKINLKTNTTVEYSIFNLNGKLVKSSTLNFNSGNSIQIQDLSKGTYILTMEINHVKTTKRFVKL